MTSLVLLLAMALACVSAALVLWHIAAQQAGRRAAARFIGDRLSQRNAVASGKSVTDAMQTTPAWRAGSGSWHGLLLRAGVVPSRGFYLRLVGIPLALAIVVGISLGKLAGACVLVFLPLLSVCRLWLKVDKRQRKMIEQLPDFLEGMVRMMAIGNSLASAFQMAATRVDQPLQEVMERALALSRGGQELDVSLRNTARQYGLRELYLVAAIIGVATRFGGRSDQVMERMAAFIRDLTQARRELVALSAEVRLSAWVLALLPLGIGCFIIMFNNALFMGMWHDPVGSKLLAGAAALQVAGSFWLYRLARLA
ncbi:MAG: type II secretion system F family protein [Burkholderiaceae bacterium]|nr:type II secretion system F family protein [Burkholderiaceae bacterium]